MSGLAARLRSPTPLQHMLLVALAVKLAMLALMAVGWFWPGFHEGAYWANFVYPFDEEPWLRSAFKTWDGNHYLFLADHGYQPFHISNAFYPLLPLLMRVAAPVALGDALVAGFAVSILCCLGAVAFLYRLVEETHGAEVARRACLVFLAFPTSFYAGLVYTESLFLVLAVGLFWLVRRGAALPALLFAIALPLTRPTGLLVAVPAMVAAFQRQRRPGLLHALLPLGFGLGFAAYLGILWTSTGDALAGFDAQRVFQASNSLGNILHPLDWFVSNFVSVELTLNGFTTSALNRAAFVAFVVAVALCARRMDRALLVYTLMVGLVPAMSGNLTSYIRYVAIAFPLFVCAAAALGRRTAWWLVPSFAVQALAVVVHASNRWVA